MQRKTSIIIIAAVFVILIAVFAYLFVFLNKSNTTSTNPEPTDNSSGNGFIPINRGAGNTSSGTVTSTTTNRNTSSTPNTSTQKLPTLRLLSSVPVGGYGASTTPNIASTTKTLPVKGTTIVRWVDRGRGNVYEARGDSNDILTISNTVMPRMFESVWNKNISAFIGSTFADGSDSVSVLYAQLKAIATPTIGTSTSSSSPRIQATTGTRSPYELKGKNLPEKMIGYTVSPKGDKIFMLVNESGASTGYIANFDGTAVTRIFTSPMTQVNVEWPEDNTIAITTKGSANFAGFMYFVNPKTGVWKKILGPINGLSTRVSRDAKYVIYSASSPNKQDITTNILNTSTNQSTDAVVITLADKCAWGNSYKEIVYCGAPSGSVQATYPDDWYKGNVAFYDKIWQINAKTGEVHLISTIVDQSDRVVDAFNLGLDSRDDYLFFMSKRDLSLWSLDLTRSN